VYLHSEIEKYESQLHQAHDLQSSISPDLNKVIRILKPCLDFFGEHFRPSFELTQVAQEFLKKAFVSLVAKVP
jgi:hypothetical protein